MTLPIKQSVNNSTQEISLFWNLNVPTMVSIKQTPKCDNEETCPVVYTPYQVWQRWVKNLLTINFYKLGPHTE